MAKTRLIGIDIGGTKTAVGLVDANGLILALAQCPTATQDGPEAIVNNAIALANDLIAKSDHPVSAVGIGSAGVVEPGTGRIVSATDAIPGWTGTDLANLVAAGTHLPCWAENDVHAHARAEAWQGAGKDYRSMLMAAIGTGIGGAFVTDGQTQVGAHGVSGLIGHFAIPEAEGIECTCGGQGHFEALCSGPAILAAFERAGGKAASAREVEDLAVAGDELAAEVFAACARATGRALGGLTNMFDPEVVVVGGGMSQAGELWWQPLREAFSQEVIPFLAKVPLVSAQLKRDSGLIGAASLALTHLNDPKESQ
ncbi:hypothetical protein BK816_05115 [Boudabousia tangfeifanii]|uniref:Glucokinase n=1 Tax=Boudabousia tangfeifanii TaxID=1912795 RepID=A0A1D9MKN7_9ACTO|nr:ROK family protein [Boudabousia tangfeifanii]AOZ72749.1 hypothetical protein BK816_05115 [Boudabousia tangfeifanii]